MKYLYCIIALLLISSFEVYADIAVTDYCQGPNPGPGYCSCWILCDNGYTWCASRSGNVGCSPGGSGCSALPGYTPPGSDPEYPLQPNQMRP